jgi:hypothetical protein
VFEQHIELTIERGRELTSAAALKLARQLASQKPTSPSYDRGSEVEGVVANLEALVGVATYRCIYVDPPWPYGNQATRASTDNHYQTMSVDDIASLPVAELAATQTHLHLWTTNGFLREAIELIEFWGFEYKSVLVCRLLRCESAIIRRRKSSLPKTHSRNSFLNGSSPHAAPL